jgi:hypothetical protein
MAEPPKRRPRQGRLAQLVERFVYTEDVGGSSPSSPTISRNDRRSAGPWVGPTPSRRPSEQHATIFTGENHSTTPAPSANGPARHSCSAARHCPSQGPGRAGRGLRADRHCLTAPAEAYHSAGCSSGPGALRLASNTRRIASPVRSASAMMVRPVLTVPAVGSTEASTT